MRATARPPLVTHVITRLIVGGAQENTVATVLGLQNRTDLRCDLISGAGQSSEGTLEGEFLGREELLTKVPSLVRPVNPFLDFTAYRELRAIFRRTRPVLVHTHSGKAGVLGRLAARRAKVPIIVHGVHGPSFGPWQGAGANALFKTAERWAARHTTHFIAVAQAMIDQYVEAGIAEPSRFTRIFSGFPLERFLTARNDPSTRAKYGLKPEDLVVGKIARITELKGHEDLFAIAPDLVERVPKLRFLLIGGGRFEEQFRERAEASGLARHFVFTGLVPPSEIPALAGIMDLLVHVSLREGLPRALPQALAAGKPVVAYDCDGAREVCITGETGILVPPRDGDGLLNAIAKLAADEPLRRKLGERGRALVKEQFGVEKMVEEIYRLYRRLLREKGLG
jgi:glycosyltransferase involved in cell wall biosynthesis